MTKKRLVKRVVALAATAMMMVGMFVPAMASPDPSRANTGTITVHKYAGAEESSVSNLTGKELETTDADHPLNNNYTALEGAEFTLYKVSNLDPVMAKLRAGETITASVVLPGATPSVRYTFSDSSVLTQGTTLINTAITSSLGVIKFGNNNLLDGVYVLVETETPEGYATATPSIVRLPLTDEDGQYNYDVHVYPKNVINTDIAVKDIVGVQRPVSVNDIVGFELKAKFLSDTVKTADDLRDGTTYGAARIMESFYTYWSLQNTPNPVRAYWLAADGTIDTTAPLTSTDITYTTLPYNGTGGSFTASLTTTGIDSAIAGGKVGFGITFTAKYLGGASVAQGETANRPKNNMTAHIRAASEAPGGGTDTPATVHAPAIAIKVVNVTSSSAPLPGVTFALAKVPVPRIDLVPGQPLSAYSSADQAIIRADYVIGEDGEPLVEVTGTDGLILFSNLPDYSNTTGATFYLKQLETVGGYKLRIPSIQVNFKDRAGYKADHPEWFDSADGWKEGAYVLETVTVKNYGLNEEGGEEPGFSLPLTGGAGTIAFTVAGIIVMLGAALLIVRKHKEA